MLVTSEHEPRPLLNEPDWSHIDGRGPCCHDLSCPFVLCDDESVRFTRKWCRAAIISGTRMFKNPRPTHFPEIIVAGEENGLVGPWLSRRMCRFRGHAAVQTAGEGAFADLARVRGCNSRSGSGRWCPCPCVRVSNDAGTSHSPAHPLAFPVWVRRSLRTEALGHAR